MGGGGECDVFRNLNYQIKREEMGGARGTWTREEKCVQNKLVRETRKRPLTRPPRKWENNIKKALKETG